MHVVPRPRSVLVGDACPDEIVGTWVRVEHRRQHVPGWLPGPVDQPAGDFEESLRHHAAFFRPPGRGVNAAWRSLGGPRSSGRAETGFGGGVPAREVCYFRTMTTRKASCTCGQLSLVAEGEPVRISMCHCHACQKRTGSVFGVQARFPRDKVRVEGRSKVYVRTADSGNAVSFYFCPECGAIVHYELDVQPDLIAVPVGAFADATFPAPTFSVYESRRHPWVDVPASCDHVD